MSSTGAVSGIKAVLACTVAGVALVLVTLMSSGGAESHTSAATDEPIKIEISDPSRFWKENGFVAIAPAIRVSVVPGAETVVYLRMPEGSRLATSFLPDQRRFTIRFPPGSEADRVSYSVLGDGSRVIDDVRGTRWDADGNQYFHVYRPADDSRNARLVGVEWHATDPRQQELATAQLIALIRSSSDQFPALHASGRVLERFRTLNNCGDCHLANKAAAQSADEFLPPWQTDASGFYVPLAVLEDTAPLSSTSFFDDPNADDRFVSASCKTGAVSRHDTGESHWFTCQDGSFLSATTTSRGHCSPRRIMLGQCVLRGDISTATSMILADAPLRDPPWPVADNPKTSGQSGVRTHCMAASSCFAL